METAIGKHFVPIALFSAALFFLFFFKINVFIYLFIFGCVGSSLLCVGSL